MELESDEKKTQQPGKDYFGSKGEARQGGKKGEGPEKRHDNHDEKGLPGNQDTCDGKNERKGRKPWALKKRKGAVVGKKRSRSCPMA